MALTRSAQPPCIALRTSTCAESSSLHALPMLARNHLAVHRDRHATRVRGDAEAREHGAQRLAGPRIGPLPLTTIMP